MMRVVKLETSPPAVGPAPPRVIIEHVSPQVEGGRYPAKGTLGETVVVEADCFADGHDALATLALCRRPGEQGWSELPMEALPNDRWRAGVIPSRARPCSLFCPAWGGPFFPLPRGHHKN